MTRRCSLKIQKSRRHNIVCRNRYRTYKSVGFVPGGTFFGTLCPTQDETMPFAFPLAPLLDMCLLPFPPQELLAGLSFSATDLFTYDFSSSSTSTAIDFPARPCPCSALASWSSAMRCVLHRPWASGHHSYCHHELQQSQQCPPAATPPCILLL